MAGVALIVIVADQVSKAWVRDNLTHGQSLPEEGLIRMTYVANTGGAFGLLHDQTLFFGVMAALIIGAILFYAYRQPPGLWVAQIAFGLQLGGAIGNLIDRFRFGYVTDFIDVRFFPWVFNVADSSIVVSVGLLAVIYFVFGERLERSESIKGAQ